ncbi:MAG: SixA phosphatase family protein [Solirubrobacteraceae bacterium]
MSCDRRLYLLRHAKSSWEMEGVADHDRPLSDRGRRAAALMADYVAAHAINPEMVLCSTAVRALSTLQAVLPGRLDGADARTAARVEHELYSADATQLLKRLQRLSADVQSVMVVGHNPTLQELALALAGGAAPDRSASSESMAELRRKLATGSLVTLAVCTEWRDLAVGGAVLLDYIRPASLTAD